MAAIPTRPKTLNSIRNHSISTFSIEIQTSPNQKTIILDKQSNFTQIPVKNIKHNTIEM